MKKKASSSKIPKKKSVSKNKKKDNKSTAKAKKTRRPRKKTEKLQEEVLQEIRDEWIPVDKELPPEGEIVRIRTPWHREMEATLVDGKWYVLNRNIIVPPAVKDWKYEKCDD